MKKIIQREIYLKKIRPFYDVDLIKVLTGIRRCGKSIILKQIMDELVNINGIKKEQIIYINFEDFEYDDIDNARKFYNLVKTRIINSNKYYLFFDEIQHVDGFEKVIASFKATNNCSIFITGSNSKLLSGELATLLVGRTIEFKIIPFTFKEAYDYLFINGKNVNEDFIYNYLKFGGFPQRFDFENEEDILMYLKQHYHAICERDVFKRNSEIEKQKFNTICSYLLANAGKELSLENILNFYNTNNSSNKKDIEKKTIYNYLDRMEKVFFVSRVKRFNIVGKDILKNKEKIYAIDLGLRYINTNLINFEDTYFLENLIYNELIIRDYTVFVGKTYKGEIDFVVIKNSKKCFIQVTYLLASKETIDREFGAFAPIKDASPKYVFSLDRLDFSHNGITHINIVDFLLNKVDIFLS